MIIDNLVIDVGNFAITHPGGKFVIRHNIGNDISKFFFGGYNLEGNLEGVSIGHKHSAYARKIVNDLTVAIYERDIPTTISQSVRLNYANSAQLTDDLKNVKLDGNSVEEAF